MHRFACKLDHWILNVQTRRPEERRKGKKGRLEGRKVGSREEAKRKGGCMRTDTLGQAINVRSEAQSRCAKE